VSVYCEYCVLLGRGLCDGLIIRPEESYRLWCVVVCDLETSRMRKPWPALGRSDTENKTTTFYGAKLLSKGTTVRFIRVAGFIECKFRNGMENRS